MADKTKSQLDKFKETARAVETDDREEAFDRALKRVARASPESDHPKRNSNEDKQDDD